MGLTSKQALANNEEFRPSCFAALAIILVCEVGPYLILTFLTIGLKLLSSMPIREVRLSPSFSPYRLYQTHFTISDPCFVD